LQCRRITGAPSTQNHIQMNQLKDDIQDLFEVYRFNPDSQSVVNIDGFDELEKKEALNIFIGKSFAQLQHHLQNDDPDFLEEWTVLNAQQ